MQLFLLVSNQSTELDHQHQQSYSTLFNVKPYINEVHRHKIFKIYCSNLCIDKGRKILTA